MKKTARWSDEPVPCSPFYRKSYKKCRGNLSEESLEIKFFFLKQKKSGFFKNLLQFGIDKWLQIVIIVSSNYTQ